jgi:hypothetical protein
MSGPSGDAILKCRNSSGRDLGSVHAVVKDPTGNAHDPVSHPGREIEHLGPSRCPPSDKRRSSPHIRRRLNNAWRVHREGESERERERERERPMGLKRHHRGKGNAKRSAERAPPHKSSIVSEGRGDIRRRSRGCAPHTASPFLFRYLMVVVVVVLRSASAAHAAC